MRDLSSGTDFSIVRKNYALRLGFSAHLIWLEFMYFSNKISLRNRFCWIRTSYAVSGNQLIVEHFWTFKKYIERCLILRLYRVLVLTQAADALA